MLGLKPGVLDQVHRHIHHITSHHITEPHRHTANDVASGHHHITSSIHRPIAHTTQAIHHTCLPTLIPECRPRHPPPLLVSLCHLFGCRRLVVVIVIVCCCAGRGGVWLGVCLRGGSVSCSGTCVCDCGCGCACVCVCVCVCVCACVCLLLSCVLVFVFKHSPRGHFPPLSVFLFRAHRPWV